MAETGDYVCLNEPRRVPNTRGVYRYAVLGERERVGNTLGWTAALVDAGDWDGRGSNASVWLRPRSFRVIREQQNRGELT